MNVRFGVVLAALALGLSGCKGGGGTSGSPSGLPTVTYSVGGTVTGLTGAGLVLQVNGAGNLAIAAPGGSFAFASPIAATTIYTVTVFAQPAGQFCSVANGSGTVTGVVTNIVVTCGVTIGGMVTGLVGTLVLQNNGGSNLTITVNSAYTFPGAVLTGSNYNVAALSKPTNQTCTVANPIGTAGTTNITNVDVVCTVNTFTIASLLDPLATQQWHLKNTGQNAFADGVGDGSTDINVDPVFTNFGFTGSGVTVAVVDTGMEILHEDLAANVVPGGSWNFANRTTNPTSSATTGDHGTSVAGLIAMAKNNVGGIGVAPQASLKGFNFLSSQSPSNLLSSLGGSSASPNSSDVFIFNQSFGTSQTNDSPIDTTLEAQYLSGVTSLRGGKGALYVKAAGNGFRNMDVTGNANCDRPFGPILAGVSCENANFDPDNTIPYQIVVGAVNADGIKASYSTAGSAIWVSAPGGEFGRNVSVSPGFSAEVYEPAMVTTDQSGCANGFSRTGVNTSNFNNGTGNTACNYTNAMNGTSSATPVTAGVIALILEANPALTWRDVKHILATTAKPIDFSRLAVSIPGLTGGSYLAEPQWTNNTAGFHFHNWYGFGMVDASAAVIMARNYTSLLGTFVNTGFVPSPPLSLSIPDNDVTGASNTISVPGTTVQTVEVVQISVTATHPFTGDLAIELTSPSLTRSVLKTGDDGFGGPNLNGMVLLSNAFYREPAAGNWTIKVVDVAPGDVGTLTGWTIRVFGH